MCWDELLGANDARCSPPSPPRGLVGFACATGAAERATSRARDRLVAARPRAALVATHAAIHADRPRRVAAHQAGARHARRSRALALAPKLAVGRSSLTPMASPPKSLRATTASHPDGLVAYQFARARSSRCSCGRRRGGSPATATPSCRTPLRLSAGIPLELSLQLVTAYEAICEERRRGSTRSSRTRAPATPPALAAEREVLRGERNSWNLLRWLYHDWTAGRQAAPPAFPEPPADWARALRELGPQPGGGESSPSPTPGGLSGAPAEAGLACALLHDEAVQEAAILAADPLLDLGLRAVAWLEGIAADALRTKGYAALDAHPRNTAFLINQGVGDAPSSRSTPTRRSARARASTAVTSRRRRRCSARCGTTCAPARYARPRSIAAPRASGGGRRRSAAGRRGSGTLPRASGSATRGVRCGAARARRSRSGRRRGRARRGTTTRLPSTRCCLTASRCAARHAAPHRRTHHRRPTQLPTPSPPPSSYSCSTPT